MQTENIAKTLSRLGLNQYEGKVFVALQQLGFASAKDITKASGVPRPKVYEALDALHELGIVIKAMTKPTTFKPIPLADAFNLMLKRKLEDFEELQTQTSSIASEFNQKYPAIFGKEANAIMLVPDKDAVVSSVQELVENAKDSIDLVTSWRRFSKISLFSSAVLKAHNRDLRVRIVVQRPQQVDTLKQIINSPQMHKSIECRTLPQAPSTVVCIYDGENALICPEAQTEPNGFPALVTNNSALVEVAKAYFEKMWQAGTPNSENGHPLPADLSDATEQSAGS